MSAGPPLPVPSISGPPGAFRLLAKPTGAVCNLDCAYCFFLSKEMLYPGSRFRMADELLETYMRQLIEAHGGAPWSRWRGGAASRRWMGLPFFRRAVELVDQYLNPGQSAVYTLQTNGTKFDAEWATFFREHDVLVGISIDGPREIHDTFRVTKGGRGSFDQVMRGLGHLRAGGVAYNVLTTVHAANERRGREVYRFLRDECEARFMQFIPIVERVTGAADPERSRSSWRDRPLYVQEGENDAVGERRRLWPVPDRRVRGVGVSRRRRGLRPDVRLDAGHWVGEQPGMRVHCETCGLALAFEHTRDLYSCDHFVEPRYLLGNISERHLIDLVASDQQQQFGLDMRDALPSYCRECEFRFACHGGCPKDRFVKTPDGEPGLNYLCPSFKLFFDHVQEPMRLMSVLLAQNRAPSELVRRYATRDGRRGRTDSCTCGSGRRWKHCHGSDTT